MIYTEDEQEQQQKELRHNLYEKRQTIQSLNISARIKKSQNEKLKETFKTLLKFIVSNLGLLIILGGYTIAGAWMFIMLEKENELTLCTEGKSNEILNVVTLKTQLINYIKNNISLSLSDLSNKDNISIANANIEQFLIGFRDQVLAIKGNYYYTGQNCLDDSKWNFPNVLLFTITIVTTIGYGQISPKTPKGQIICICYATIGIPIFLMCCSNISGICSRMFRFTYSRICCGICYLKNKKKAIEEKLAKQLLNINNNEPAQIIDEEPEHDDDEEEEEEKVSVPLTITIFVIFLYLLAGGYLFNYFESWPVVTGIYFCYVTLSTIGFGDYVPGQNMNDPNRNTNLIIGAIYIFFGLAILAMCFDLMQEEIIAKFTWVGSKIGMVKKDEDDLDDDDDNDDLNEKKQDLINSSNLLQQQQQQHQGQQHQENKEIANTNLSYYQSKYSTNNDQYNNTTNNLLFQRQTNSSEK